MLKIEKNKTNPVLRKKSEPVKEITPAILRLISQMRLTLRASANGIGLAAPQVGRPIRLFVIADEIAKENRTVFINPAITQSSRKKVVAEEGCLSLPELWQELARAEKVTVKATDERGRKFKLRAKGILARLMQHELDHLNGILFIDHFILP